MWAQGINSIKEFVSDLGGIDRTLAILKGKSFFLKMHIEIYIEEMIWYLGFASK